MSKKAKFKSKKPALKLEKQAQVSAKIETPLSFADLIVDESLPPVKVKMRRTKKKKRPDSDDTLLTELQCEV